MPLPKARHRRAGRLPQRRWRLQLSQGWQQPRVQDRRKQESEHPPWDGNGVLHVLENTYLCALSIPVASPESQPLGPSGAAMLWESRTNLSSLVLSYRPHWHPTASTTLPRASGWLLPTPGAEATAKPGRVRGGNRGKLKASFVGHLSLSPEPCSGGEGSP